MPWLSVSIDATGTDAEMLSERLSDAGAVAVTVQPSAEARPVVEPGPGETPIWSGVKLDALFPVDAKLDPLHALIMDLTPELAADLPAELPAGGGRVTGVDFVADREWTEAWRQSVVLQHYGGCLSVVPRDHPADDLAGCVVRLDPGLAFGTGAHATTSMCLEALASRDLSGLNVADVGCGSGILAIAALALGAAAVLAIDHDPQALLATTDNAAYNEVSGARLTTVDSLPTGREYQLVVANILDNPLIELADGVGGLVEVGGTLILSGILAAQLDGVLAAYPTVAFEPPNCRDGWVCVEGIRRIG